MRYVNESSYDADNFLQMPIVFGNSSFDVEFTGLGSIAFVGHSHAGEILALCMCPAITKQSLVGQRIRESRTGGCKGREKGKGLGSNQTIGILSQGELRAEGSVKDLVASYRQPNLEQVFLQIVGYHATDCESSRVRRAA